MSPPRPRPPILRRCGGRRWWAHLTVIPINVGRIIVRNKIEELMNIQGIGERNFLRLKPLVSVTPPRPSER